MNETKVSIGIVQMSMSVEKQENIDKALRMIDEAVKKKANVVCLPELFSTQYFPRSESKEPFELAEEITGRTAKILSETALKHGITLIGGSIFEKDKKKFYNTSLVFAPSGKLVGTYRKLHIPHDPFFFEQSYFAKGDKGTQVFETPHGKFSVPICYDQWFPEAARVMAMQGAEILFYPTAIGMIEGNPQSFGSWQDAWETIQRSHAIANSVVVCAANRVGIEGNLKFWGGSFICNQFGKILVKGTDKEQVLVADVNLADGPRIRDDWRFVYERRPDVYGSILKDWPKKKE